MLIEYPKRFMLKWKRPRGCVERDNLRRDISISGLLCLSLIVNLFGVKRRSGQMGDWTGEPRLIGKRTAHSKFI